MSDLKPLCTGRHFGEDLCKLLGLPQATKTISIHFDPDNIVCVDATFYVTVDEVEELVSLMKGYKMEPLPEAEKE